MPPLSEAMVKVITDAGSAIVAVVARIQFLPISDDAALRSWARDFAVAVSRYRGVTRLLTKHRDNSYIEPTEVKDAFVTADTFLLKNTHWTWDETWLDPRWKRAALDRKEIWEAEEERRQKLKEEEENKTLLAEAEAYLRKEVVVFDYPTKEEWEALRNQPPLQESAVHPIHFFNPNLDTLESDTSIEYTPLSLSDMSSSPPPSASTTQDSPKMPAGDINRIFDDEVPQINSSSSRTGPASQLDGKQKLREQPIGRIGPPRNGLGPTKAADRAGAFERRVSSASDTISQTSTGPSGISRPPAKRASLPTTKGLKSALNSTPIKNSTNKTNSQATKTNSIASTSQTPGRSQSTVPTSTQVDFASLSSPEAPSTTRHNVKRPHDDVDEDEQTDVDDEYVRFEGGNLIGTGQLNSPSCSSCSKVNSKCFRLNGKSCCARCYQEHQKCPLDKSKAKKQRLNNTVG